MNKIIIVSYDRKERIANNPKILVGKLRRDGFDLDNSNILHISWSKKSNYFKLSDNFEIVQMGMMFFDFRPFYDLLSILLVPIIAIRYSFKPNVFVVYDFPLIFSCLYFKLLKSAKIVLILINLPYNLVQTRENNRAILYYMLSEKICKFLIDKVLVISETARQYVLNLGVRQKKIRIFVPNVIKDEINLIKQSSDKYLLKNLFNISPEYKIILSVGRLEIEKGFDLLLNLFAQLDKKYILLIVGEGSQITKLKSQAKTLGISDRVIFTGFVDRDEIWNYFHESHVFVLLSRSEGLGIVFWEAMYSGLFVIGSNVGGIRESIGLNGERGILLSDPIRMIDFTKSIDFASTHSLERDKIIDRAREYVREKIRCFSTFDDLISGT